MGRKYHYFYIVQHKFTGIKYAGIHSTDDINDGYVGSGIIIERIVKKYGNSVFEVLSRIFFDTRELASEYEKDFVTIEIANSDLWYNLKTGGDNCGIPNNATRDRMRKTHLSIGTKPPSSLGKTRSMETRNKLKMAHQNRSTEDEYSRRCAIGQKHRGKILSEATREKISKNSKSGTDEVKKKNSEGQRRLSILECPHCGKRGRGRSGMKQFHFDNCKHKEMNK